MPDWQPRRVLRGDLPDDLGCWLRACEMGEITAALGGLLGIPVATEDDLERNKKKIKDLLFRHFYGDKPLTRRRSDLFADAFPTVDRFLRRLKQSHYKVVYRAATRFESELMIHGACGRLMREHPGIAVLTIHECLMVPLKDEAKARQAIWDEYLQYGVVPNLKRKEGAFLAGEDLARLTDPLA
jgi:hypothetical protein